MSETKSVSTKQSIFEMIKNKFACLSFWKIIEGDIAILCSDLVDPSSHEKSKELVKQLTQIKDFFLGHDVSKEELIFIDQEIERFEGTKTISLYEEEDDEINPEYIEYYSRHAGKTEGVVGIHLPLNYTQAAKLTNGVFKKTGLIKFYIPREKTIYGKILAEVYEHAQEIPIATLVESKKQNKETGEPEFRGVSLFGKHPTAKTFTKIKEMNLPFYVYRFITESNKEMILMSASKCDIGDYIVTGVSTKCDDYKMLTDSAKLPTKLPFFFAQKIMNRIIKFKNHAELKVRLDNLGINRESFLEYPFTIKKGDKSYKLINHDWYKDLIWSFLTHQPKGLFNNYPMHLMIMGPKHSGKSLLLNGLHAKSKENRDIFSGSSSTLKSLVPSFKYNPAKLGYLAESNRFSFCDEFFRCLLNTRTTKDGSQREEAVAMMNDLLEHQKRRAGSGVSSVNVNMTARIIATTNPIRGMDNISDLINSFDESFLSRWLIYHQTEDHVALVRHSNDCDLEEYKFEMSENDWIAILDYLHTFSAKYDMKKLDEIHSSVQGILSENLERHYDARHKHHIECLIDGIVKTRCLLDGDMSFEANEEDYKKLERIWMKIVGSWMDLSQIKYMDINKRIFYLPENAQYLYWKVAKSKTLFTRLELQELSLKSMTKKEFTYAILLLNENELLRDSGDLIKAHFMKDDIYPKQKEL